MTSVLPDTCSTTVRMVQYADLDTVEQLFMEAAIAESATGADRIASQLRWVRRWYGLIKALSLVPGPLQNLFCVYVTEQGGQVKAATQVTPSNFTRSTWRVDQVGLGAGSSSALASMLIRHCFEVIWEARMWLAEANVSNKDLLALYRQNGFQPLAERTYWSIPADLLAQLAKHEPDLPNLLPVSNADAQLLYQLDTAAMPPLVRQVFDRHIQDFKTGLISGLMQTIRNWVDGKEILSAYVFEPQRKAAIGYFKLQRCRDGSQPHLARLTVHPAYTWLYPELIAQMARLTQVGPAQSLQLASADYQPEREAYLEQVGAQRTAHTLLMSRSVWHKLRESRSVSLESLQLSGMLRGFQPSQKPIPGRISVGNLNDQSPSSPLNHPPAEPLH